MKLLGFLCLLVMYMMVTACASQGVNGFNELQWLDKVPDVEITETAKRVLAQYEGNILAPESVTSLRPLNKPLGWSFRMSYQKRQYDEDLDPVYVLTAIEGQEYYFDSLSPLLSGAVWKYKWVGGRRLKYKFDKYKYEDAYEEKCKFKLGACEYQGLVTKVDVHTEYQDGVWIRKERISSRRFLTDYVTRVEIYDASGLPLYRRDVVHTDKIFKHKPNEYVRTEYLYRGIDDEELKLAARKGDEIRSARGETLLQKERERIRMGR